MANDVVEAEAGAVVVDDGAWCEEEDVRLVLAEVPLEEDEAAGG